MVYSIYGCGSLTWVLWRSTGCFSWSSWQQPCCYSIEISSVQHPRFPSAEHRRRPSWPRATAAARDPSGRGWPDCATSILKPTNKRRMFPGCDLCSSLSNRPLWCVRGEGGALSSRNFLPFWILTSHCFWRAQTAPSLHNLSSVHNLWDTPSSLPLSCSSFLSWHWLYWLS